MMHHPNMHHQAMSGHPPQHLAGHQPLPRHHAMPPPLHRENRHVTLTRVPLGPSGGGMAHGQMGAHGMPVHHGGPRAPHPIRAMTHHPPQHHPMPQMKLRRPYNMGGGYVHTYHTPMPAPSPSHSAHSGHSGHSANTHSSHHSVSTTNIRGTLSPTLSTMSTSTLHSSDFNGICPVVVDEPTKEASSPETGEDLAESTDTILSNHDADVEAAGEHEASNPSASAQANSKEKTPMCLVNELARYNKKKHQYRLTSEQGPAHKKVFTVTLRLGETEEYTAEGSSIKRAQHAAANAALSGTAFPAPPPRAAQVLATIHHHNRHSVMPTVELNALMMKLCQPAVYTSVPPVPMGVAVGVGAHAGRGRAWAGFPRVPGPAYVYRVRLAVGGRAWMGEGGTPQAARHDAAARALVDLRSQRHPQVDPPPDPDADEESSDPLNSEVKSPVSLVHELALKRNLSVIFTVKSEHGPPHMRVFITLCTVGDMETEGEGNGKKVSKRRAAEKMLEEMRTRWPPAALRPRLSSQDKRRHKPAKKKPRNLIKEGGVPCAMAVSGSDNPISRLAVARHAARARSPQYRLLEERGAARRREFLVQCLAPPHAATGLGPNKKAAKRRAAHNVLLAMELTTTTAEAVLPSAKESGAGAATAEAANTSVSGDAKRKEGETVGVTSGGGGGDVRQPVPGVLMMDYHQRNAQPHTNGVSESTEPSSAPAPAVSAPAGVGVVSAGSGSSPGSKDQLMYLSHLLGFTVQFSDFPKRNHGEYLSLVSLSTEPPVMCHGGGPSTAHSHEQCSRAALRALALMGLDTMQNPSPGAGSTPIVNGVSE